MTGVALETEPPASRPTARPDAPVLLDPYAACSCPVKTQHAYDPSAVRPPRDPLEVAMTRSQRHRAEMLQALLDSCPGRVVDLRLLSGEPGADQVLACLRALTSGADVVIGGRLPADPAGHRMGRSDLLVRGQDGPGGPVYHPVLIKAHQVLEAVSTRPQDPAAPASPVAAVVRRSPLTRPYPQLAAIDPDQVWRARRQERDLLQLAHLHELLTAAGFGAARAVVGVVGRHPGPGEPEVAWVDLDDVQLRTFSRRSPAGWRWRSVRDRYTHELALRVAVAEAARRPAATGGGSAEALVQPIVVWECATCPWWSRCRPQLADDDVSLRIDRGRLDPREVLALRRLGLGTVTALADADLSQVLPSYLPEVGHHSTAEARLRTAARRARMLVAGRPLERETEGLIEVPRAEVEIDLDLESAADGRTYLWGFLVYDTTRPGPPRYVEFSRFDDLDEQAETALAVRALSWLRGLLAEREGLVYHYSAYEVVRIRELAARATEPELTWAVGYAEEHFVDLYEIVRAHFFGANGLGLKLVAKEAGFGWRDDDPGGLNSQRWFLEATHGPVAQARLEARRRVLEYNEDDVIATSRLRAWLRAQ